MGYLSKNKQKSRKHVNRGTTGKRRKNLKQKLSRTRNMRGGDIGYKHFGEGKSYILGEGSFGISVKVQCTNDTDKIKYEIDCDANDKTLFALKLVRYTPDSKREFEILYELSKERSIHIINLINSYIYNQNYYLLFMELGEKDYFKYIYSRNRKDLTKECIDLIFLAMYKGLEFIHSKNIYHRDIKLENFVGCKLKTQPSNVGITVPSDFLIPKFIDFGLSSKNEKFDEIKISQVGTPRFLSPEVKQSKSYGRDYDIWSLGVTYLEICTKECPEDDMDDVTGIEVNRIYNKNREKVNSLTSFKIMTLLDIDPDERKIAFRNFYNKYPDKAQMKNMEKLFENEYNSIKPINPDLTEKDAMIVESIKSVSQDNGRDEVEDEGTHKSTISKFSTIIPRNSIFNRVKGLFKTKEQLSEEQIELIREYNELQDEVVQNIDKETITPLQLEELKELRDELKKKDLYHLVNKKKVHLTDSQKLLGYKNPFGHKKNTLIKGGKKRKSTQKRRRKARRRSRR